MLDAILSTPAQRAAPGPAGAGQKPHSDDARGFDSIYGRSNAAPERRDDGSRDRADRDGTESQVSHDAEKQAKTAARPAQPLVALTTEGEAQIADTDPTAIEEPEQEPERTDRPDVGSPDDLLKGAQTTPESVPAIAPPETEQPIDSAEKPTPRETFIPHDRREAEVPTTPHDDANSDEQIQDRPALRDAAVRSDSPPRAEAAAPRAEASTDRTATARADADIAVANTARAVEAAAPRAVEAAQPTAPVAEPAPVVSGTGGPQLTAAAQSAASVQTAPSVASSAVEQLALAVKQSGDGRIDLTLSPAELGRVRLTLLTGETGITVAIRADRDDTLDLFRRNSDALAQEFRQMGYGSVGFEFSGGGSDQQRARNEDSNAITPPEPAAPLPREILRAAGVGGLDIRL